MAYKVFTNGSPLPASDLNTYLMNQSVMVFADSTARSAALTAPTEGMVTYLEDTGLVYVYNGSSWVDINDNSAAIPKSTVTTAGDLIVATGNAAVTRLGIGTNGQVLSSNGTTATWTTPSGGGGMTLLSTTTLSGISTTISSINQTYKRLIVLIQGVYTNIDGVAMYIEPRNGTNVQYVNSTGRFYNGSSASDFSIGGDVIYMGGLLTNSSSQTGTMTLEIESYSEAVRKTFSYYGGAQDTNTRAFYSFGTIRGTNSIDSLRFTTYGTETFSGGTVRIYGVS